MSSFLKNASDAVLDEMEGRETARDEERKNRVFEPWRFFLKDEKDDKNIIFLTGAQDGEDVPVVEQHHIEINGKWGNFFTCLKAVGEECPFCEAGNDPQTLGFYLIIDRSSHTSAKGKTYKDTLKVLPAPFKALKNLKKLAAKSEGRGLKGIEYNVSRSSSNAPKCGDQFNKETVHDGAAIKKLLGDKKLSEKLGAESVQAFWEKYLAPKPKADLVVIVSQKQTGTESSSVGTTDGADVNFDD